MANMNMPPNANGGGGGNDVTMATVDAKIDGLFDLGSTNMVNMEMDYDLGGASGDNSNFNDLYFNADDNIAPGEFDGTYYNI